MTKAISRQCPLRRRVRVGIAIALAVVGGSVFSQPAAVAPSVTCQVLTPGSPPDAPAVVPGMLQLVLADAPQTAPGLPPRPGSAQVLHLQAPPGVAPDLVSGKGLVVLTPGAPPGMPAIPPGSLKVITPTVLAGKC